MLEKELSDLVNKNLPAIAAESVLRSLEEAAKLKEENKNQAESIGSLKKDIEKINEANNKLVQRNDSLEKRNEFLDEKSLELQALEIELKKKEINQEKDMLQCKLDEAEKRNRMAVELFKVVFKNPVYQKEHFEDIRVEAEYDNNGNFMRTRPSGKNITDTEKILEDN